MQFTPSQKKALLFIFIIFQAAFVYHWLDQWLNPVESYDFSQFEERFHARKDSIDLFLNGEIKELAGAPPGLSPLAVDERGTDAREQSATLSVNINTASLEELQMLPRVGPKTAARIIAHRSERGPFKTKKELTRVKGIGPKTLEKLRPLIVVE